MSRSCTEPGPAALRIALAVTGFFMVATLARGQVPAPAGMPETGTKAKVRTKARVIPAATGPAAQHKRADARLELPPTGKIELAPQINLPEGKSTLMHLPYSAARLSVGDPGIADIILLNPREIYMLGKSVGATNLIVWNQANDATIIDINVGIDITGLQTRITQLLPGEKNITITAAADTVILSGMVTDTVKADQALALANAYVQRAARGVQTGPAPSTATPGPSAAVAQMSGAISVKVVNMLSIAAPQQVMLEVKVAEVSKTLVDRLGASIGASKTSGSWTYTLLSNLLTNNPNLVDGFNSKNGNFATLDAQKRDGLIKVLAEPTIMAISGQEASFLAGGKIFIPINQTSSGGIATITLEEKEFGVAVKFTPTVLEGGRINLRVAPEVSELNKDGIGITASGINSTAILPSFTTRRASTTVQLYDGQSFAIGGLIKNNVTTNIKALPLLGEIPVLGALFRSSDFQTDRTELVFIITPHLVKPLPPDFKLPTDNYIEPSRAEFFMGGKMEGTPPPQEPAPRSQATGFELK
ncbi:MAG: pilus assembly protein CpaC [Janthinobacterium sp.]|jgi:pilus assembly protein CpaC